MSSVIRERKIQLGMLICCGLRILGVVLVVERLGLLPSFVLSPLAVQTVEALGLEQLVGLGTCQGCQHLFGQLVSAYKKGSYIKREGCKETEFYARERLGCVCISQKKRWTSVLALVGLGGFKGRCASDHLVRPRRFVSPATENLCVCVLVESKHDV